MHSAIYAGSVRHRRFAPVENAFRYRLFFMYLDLAELPSLFRSHRLWSVGRPNLAWFRRADYLGDPQLPLDQSVRRLVRARLGTEPGGPVRMLAHLRYFGYCFNPVTFYYCFNASDTDVDVIVAEINNTPWLERHPYVFGAQHNEHSVPYWRRYRFRKEFHVSPFMDMNIDCDWRFRVPGRRLNVHMVNFEGGRRIFDATLDLRRREISTAQLSKVLIQYPLMTAKVTAMIYWQALRLYRKGAPFYPHPAKRGQRSDG
jgi:DUF1365 family protein